MMLMNGPPPNQVIHISIVGDTPDSSPVLDLLGAVQRINE